MTDVDIRTLLGLLAVVNIFLSLVMLVYWRTQRVYPGFGLWSLCNVTVAVIWILFFLRGYIPAYVSIVTPTGLALVAVILRLEGLRRYLGRERFDYRILAVPVVGLAMIVYFTSGSNNAYARTAISTLVIALVVWVMAWLVWVRVKGRYRLVYGVIGTLWFLYGAMNAARGIYWLAISRGNPLLEPNVENATYFVANVVFDIAWTVVFITMNHQRTAIDLEAAQKAAESGRDELADIVAFLPDATFAVNELGEVISWNRAAEQLTGAAAESVLGRPYHKSVAPILGERKTILLDLALDPSVSPPDHYLAVHRDGEKVSAEVANLELAGKLVSLWATATPLRDKSGKLRGAIESMRDITAIKNAERALRESEEQLRQSQKMEAVGQLAGGIAHDFNNLLTAIIGYSDLALGSPALSDAGLRDDVQEIRRAAERAGVLTRQILAYSRKQALRPDVVSLNEVIASMSPLLRRTLGGNIDLVALQHPSLGLVEVDLNQFEQVLLNLALNARDAMSDGGRLTLETGNVELDEEYCRTHADIAPGRYVMLSVSDTGVGMDAETKSRVFEPFFTTKAPGKGTGLGLSVAYGIVRQSGGNVYVYSEPGSGTSIKIYLPRVTDRSSAPETVLPEVHASAEGHESIIVVEDEASLRHLVDRVLGSAGYSVSSFGSADEALAVLELGGKAVDLLVTDVVLPGGVQGDELARRVVAALPGTPVLYMSGYTRNAIVHAGRLDAGVNFLEKPFTPEALTQAVRKVLDGQT
jgi:PAS domain S-box-containing protein